MIVSCRSVFKNANHTVANYTCDQEPELQAQIDTQLKRTIEVHRQREGQSH